MAEEDCEELLGGAGVAPARLCTPAHSLALQCKVEPTWPPSSGTRTTGSELAPAEAAQETTTHHETQTRLLSLPRIDSPRAVSKNTAFFLPRSPRATGAGCERAETTVFVYKPRWVCLRDCVSQAHEAQPRESPADTRKQRVDVLRAGARTGRAARRVQRCACVLPPCVRQCRLGLVHTSLVPS